MRLLPRLVSPADAMFLLPETREQPMHVGGLQLFVPPPGVDAAYLSQVFRDALATTTVAPEFRRRPYRSAATLGQWAWEDDVAIDLEHHVRHSALPQPGRVRELLALSSRLHSTLLDRSRPMWEVHLVEGLADGRFAVYTKLHHSLMDGISALKLLLRSLSPDPDRRDMPMPFAVTRPPRPRTPPSPLALVSDAASTVSDVATLVPRLAKVARSAFEDGSAPGQAPRSILNTTISGSRRFAADRWDLARVKAVGTASGTTVNDVVLAMCAGALRDYLAELGELPDAPLVAMTPVSLRTADDEGGGNAVGTILCNLGTDLDDAGARLARVHASMVEGKQSLAGLSRLQVTALGAAVLSPLLLNSFGAHKVVRPPYNLVISNVPGPREPLYWNGARLDEMYPLSIPTAGQALNITVTSYVDSLQIGLTACRRSLPHVQRLLGHLEQALLELEKATL